MVVVDGMAKILGRGVITSRTVLSPNSTTDWMSWRSPSCKMPSSSAASIRASTASDGCSGSSGSCGSASAATDEKKKKKKKKEHIKKKITKNSKMNSTSHTTNIREKST